MTGKNVGTMVAGAALTMAAGTAAYMAMTNNSGSKKAKKMKKNTSKALRTVGSVVNQIGNMMN
ncbi:MAG: hypothetical protein RSD67_07370 [Oscillospiraceae bacterium]